MLRALALSLLLQAPPEDLSKSLPAGEFANLSAIPGA